MHFAASFILSLQPALAGCFGSGDRQPPRKGTTSPAGLPPGTSAISQDDGRPRWRPPAI